MMAFSGWFGKRTFGASDQKVGMFFVLTAHLQLIIGLILYVMKGWYNGMSSMSDPVVRFWAMEHFVGMLLGIVIITIGRARGKRKETNLAKHKTFAIYYTIGLIIVIALIPWPMKEDVGRALFPF